MPPHGAWEPFTGPALLRLRYSARDDRSPSAGDITRGMGCPGRREGPAGSGRRANAEREARNRPRPSATRTTATAPRHGSTPRAWNRQAGAGQRRSIPRRSTYSTRIPIASPVGVNSAGIWPPLGAVRPAGRLAPRHFFRFFHPPFPPRLAARAPWPMLRCG